ncbi:neuropeptide CCHamide-1 receptor-like [Amphiura filiformis]|uniref:neuropeptide CCHamide-1 receptor-like n=1 Tax=Amphiura filiformis TaxID=82378 RepID=UPI003B220852
MENCTNVTNATCVDGDSGQGYVLNTRRKVMLSIDILMFIIGFFGNGSVIFITLRHRGLRTVPNLLITNLAFGDLMFIMSVVFINILYPLLPGVHLYMFHFCEFFYFVQFLSLGVSVFTLTALSVDRYTTVAYPMHKQRIARRLTIWTVVIIWFISIAVCCPWFTLINDNSCWFNKSISSAIYLISLMMLMYIAPTIIMIVCYFLTAKRLLHKNASLNLDPRGGNKQQKKRSRLAVIVLVMTIAFILCSTLVYVWFLTAYFSPFNRFVTNQVVKETKSLLNKINSVINPIILYLMSTTYRRYFLQHFCFFLKCSNGKRERGIITQTQPSTNGTDLARQSTRLVNVPLREGMAPIKEEDSRI